MKTSIIIRPFLEKDLEHADRITRTAFGTFHQLPNPETYMGDANVVCTRWRANPKWSFAAELDNRVVGSVVFARWGSFGYFGPLAVDPEFWGLGIAKALINPILDVFAKWQLPHTGLFTFGHSNKHLSIYHGYGFRARGLTLILEKILEPGLPVDETWQCFSTLDKNKRLKALEDCKQLTDSIFTGLDLSHEIISIANQKLGDTLLIYKGKRLTGFAACHCGAGTEAGGGACYTKFAAAAPGPDVEIHFNRLLSACQSWALARHAGKLVIGMNVERGKAYDMVLEQKFQISRTGVAMLKPNQPGFNAPDAFVIDDWR